MYTYKEIIRYYKIQGKGYNFKKKIEKAKYPFTISKYFLVSDVRDWQSFQII